MVVRRRSAFRTSPTSFTPSSESRRREMFRSRLVGGTLKVGLVAIVVFDLFLVFQVTRPPAIAPTGGGGNVAPAVEPESSDDRVSGESSTGDEPSPRPANTGGSRPSGTRNEPERDRQARDGPDEGPPSRADREGESVPMGTVSGADEPVADPSEGPSHVGGGGGGSDEGDDPEGDEPGGNSGGGSGSADGPGGGDPGGGSSGGGSEDDDGPGGGGGGGGP